jgi:hypothetical protein
MSNRWALLKFSILGFQTARGILWWSEPLYTIQDLFEDIQKNRKEIIYSAFIDVLM